MELQSKFTIASNVTGAEKVRALGKDVSTLGSELERVAAIGLSATTGLAALATAGVAALVRLTTASIDFASAIEDASSAAGLAGDTFQALSAIAGANGVATDQFAAAMQRFTSQIGAAANGSAEAKAIFDRLGVSVKDANGNVRDTHDILLDASDGLGRINNTAQRARDAVELFGKAAGGKFAVSFGEGRQAVLAHEEAMRRLGAVLSNETKTALDDVGDRIDLAGRRMKVATAESVLPLAEALAKLAEFGADAAGAFLKVEKAVRHMLGVIGEPIAALRDALSVPGFNDGAVRVALPPEKKAGAKPLAYTPEDVKEAQRFYEMSRTEIERIGVEIDQVNRLASLGVFSTLPAGAKDKILGNLEAQRQRILDAVKKETKAKPQSDAEALRAYYEQAAARAAQFSASYLRANPLDSLTKPVPSTGIDYSNDPAIQDLRRQFAADSEIQKLTAAQDKKIATQLENDLEAMSKQGVDSVANFMAKNVEVARDAADRIGNTFEQGVFALFSDGADGMVKVFERALAQMALDAGSAAFKRILQQQFADILNQQGGAGGGGFWGSLIGALAGSGGSYAGASSAIEAGYASGAIPFATGGSFVVPGSSSGDNVMPLMRVNGGERVTVTPKDTPPNSGAVQIIHNIDARGADPAAAQRMQAALQASERRTIAAVHDMVRRRRI
jgi:hypothetical protein